MQSAIGEDRRAEQITAASRREPAQDGVEGVGRGEATSEGGGSSHNVLGAA